MLKSLFFIALIFFHVSVVFAQKKLACVGNSVTYGATLADPEKSSYPAILQNLLGDQYKVGNFGHSGATLLRKGHNPYFKTKAFTEAIRFKPDIVIIHLGLNDTDPRNWPDYRDEFTSDYSWLIDTFRSVNPDVQIFISRLSPIFSSHRRFISGTRDWYWQIQDKISLIATANKVRLIDFHSPLYFRPDLLPDAIHPNEEGAEILAQTVYSKLTGDYGGLRLDGVFSSHMVLQRNIPVKFYGTANAGEMIDIRFSAMNKMVTADDDGRWMAEFPAMKAGGPYKATFTSASGNIILDDILIGEVWVCSGQSNMAFPLHSSLNSTEEMRRAQYSSRIRLLNKVPVVQTGSFSWDSSTLEKINQLNYFEGNWEVCDSANAKPFSAVAYYFGQQLYNQLDVPVGLINISVGGSTTESWIDRYTMEHDPVLVNELNGWKTSDFFQPWVRERTALNIKNSTSKDQRHPYGPAYNYEAGISKLTQFPVKGVIWYQGESNTHNPELHDVAFQALVKSWRKHWGFELPFYYVQLSSLNRPSWPVFRFRQLQLLKKIPSTGMAVSSDVGDSTDVHPKRKKEVGDRLALLALHFTYDQKNITPYGPMPVKAIRVGKKIVIYFDYAKGNLKTRNNEPLTGFTLINDKGMVSEAKAIIRGNKVEIGIPSAGNPIEVRYGWEPFTNANLENREGLPASTFKLEVQ